MVAFIAASAAKHGLQIGTFGHMGDGNLHRHSDLPTLMAGTLGGAFRGGHHVNYPLDTPMSNLLVSMLGKLGVEASQQRAIHGASLPEPPFTTA